MGRSYNTSLVLIRFFGLIGVVMGIMWLVNLVATFALRAFGAPDWLINPLWYVASQGLLSGPIWAAAGIVVLKYSVDLARFVARGNTDSE
jgi:hypothetical protein